MNPSGSEVFEASCSTSSLEVGSLEGGVISFGARWRLSWTGCLYRLFDLVLPFHEVVGYWMPMSAS